MLSGEDQSEVRLAVSAAISTLSPKPVVAAVGADALRLHLTHFDWRVRKLILLLISASTPEVARVGDEEKQARMLEAFVRDLLADPRERDEEVREVATEALSKLRHIGASRGLNKWRQHASQALAKAERVQALASEALARLVNAKLAAAAFQWKRWALGKRDALRLLVMEKLSITRGC